MYMYHNMCHLDVRTSSVISDQVSNEHLSFISHINCIVAHWLDKRWLSHDICLYQVMMTLYFLNDVANGA